MVAAIRKQLSSTWLSDLLLIAISTSMLSAAALLYLRVAIFHDSGTYYIYGEHITSEIRSVLERNRQVIIPLGEDEEDYVGARSPTYSLILYGLTYETTLWGVLFLQAVAASWLLLTISKAVKPNHYARFFLALVFGLMLGSSLPYFVSFAMPDVFAGLGALALLTYLGYADRLTWNARVGLLLMIALAASFHPTIPLILIAAALAGTLTALLAGETPRRSTIALGTALSAILLGMAAPPFYRAVEHHYFDHRITAPPFVMARLLEDGTGADYLTEECSRTPRHTFCQVPIQPPIDSDSFLWNQDENGTYLVVEPPQRERLRQEEMAFALGTVASRPLEQLRISATNWWRQLGMNEVVEPIADPRTQTSFGLFENVNARPGEDRQYSFEALLERFRTTILLASTAALTIVLVMAVAAMPKSEERRRIVVIIVVAMVAVLASAAITGMLSKPYPRYQARISWLLPAVLAITSVHPLLTARLRRMIPRRRATTQIKIEDPR
jgi:hypothetical protein